ncbi:MAG TPA: hypothetical protein VN836_04575 [Verrucomicrobiae bacterium]|nr:hypothetical protein [Verrucomicrobiae bacterium]
MKAPSTKRQSPEKRQIPNSRKSDGNERVVWNLKFGISLVLGA